MDLRTFVIGIIDLRVYQSSSAVFSTQDPQKAMVLPACLGNPQTLCLTEV